LVKAAREAFVTIFVERPKKLSDSEDTRPMRAAKATASCSLAVIPDRGKVYKRVMVTVMRKAGWSADGAGVGTADGAAVGVMSTVAMVCTCTTKVRPK
jgi:hypothetical protein